MTDHDADARRADAPILTRAQASAAVGHLGWRYLLGELRTAVPVGSIAAAAEVCVRVTSAAGPEAGAGVRLDLRADRVTITLASPVGAVTAREVALAEHISAAVGGTTGTAPPRPPQSLELAIDALDIPAIRPFWKAVMGYMGEPGDEGPTGALVDPLHEGPAIWFQQMDAPRPQRNRIHLDLCLPHDEAPARLRAALDAGGVLVSDRGAPAFWILADEEGNEVCITTWQGRDG